MNSSHTSTTRTQTPPSRSLTDPSPYVRKTGVMGILKLYHLAPELVKGSNMVDLLYNMIQDPDVHVRTRPPVCVSVCFSICDFSPIHTHIHTPDPIDATPPHPYRSSRTA